MFECAQEFDHDRIIGKITFRAGHVGFDLHQIVVHGRLSIVVASLYGQRVANDFGHAQIFVVDPNRERLRGVSSIRKIKYRGIQNIQ